MVVVDDVVVSVDDVAMVDRGAKAPQEAIIIVSSHNRRK